MCQFRFTSKVENLFQRLRKDMKKSKTRNKLVNRIFLAESV